MKLSHLSLAVVTAIALAACGTSNTNPVDDGAGKTPIPPVDKGNLNGVNANGLEGGALPVSLSDVDLNSTSTTGASNYVRGASSKFDFVKNTDPKATASATGIVTQPLDAALDNFFGAEQDSQSKDGKIVANYFGKVSLDEHDYSQDAGHSNDTNLQEENTKNVALATAAINKTDDNWNQLADDAHFNDGTTVDADADYGKNSRKDADLKQATNKINGLVAIGFVKDSKTQAPQGVDANINTTTRVLGHLYNAATDGTANSYSGDVTVGTNGEITFGTQKLDHVQFGRVTGDNAALTKDQEDAAKLKYDFGPNSDTIAIYKRGWMLHNDPASVSYYFYRGTDASSAKQVADAIAAASKAGKITYQGTALAYGVSNTESDSGKVIPNALGGGAHNQVILGNFVEATVDTATQNVNGSIYNTKVTKDSNGKYSTDNFPLITFDGTIQGNTVKGTATAKGYADQGKLTASFFGPNAEELGGSVNSVSEKYAPAKWGAVFGAQRTAAPAVGGGNHFFLEGNGELGPKE